MNSITPQHILSLYRNVLTSWAASSLFLHNTLSLRNGFIILPNGHPAQNWPRPGGDQFNSGWCPWLLTPVFANSPPLWWADILGHCANVKSRAKQDTSGKERENVINLFPKFASITLFQTCPFLSARWPLNLETRINGFSFQEHLIKVSSKENTNTCKRNHQATFPGSLWIFYIHSYISPRNRCNALNFK